jgi:hypothetical protein
VGPDRGDPQGPLIATRKGLRCPRRSILRGVSDKERRQYEHFKEEAKKEGRYRGREKEVAARTVMKQHKKKGHRKGR